MSEPSSSSFWQAPSVIETIPRPEIAAAVAISFRVVVSREGASSGTRVNAVAPGPIETPMLDRVPGGDKNAEAAFLGAIPQQRAGAPDEVAATIAFLAGDKANYITGEIVTIDGGFAAG